MGARAPHRPTLLSMTNLHRRWPTALALVMTVDNMFSPGPLAPWTLFVLAFAYPAIGLFRGTLRPPAVRNAQWAMATVYVGLVLLAALLPHVAGQFVVGAGWLLHAGWDFYHHRHDLVVRRGFAEWCGVVDLVIGVSVLAVAIGQL